MKRNDITDKKEIERLDAVNRERKDQCQKELISIMNKLNETYNLCSFSFNDNKDKIANKIAKAVNSLEAVEEKMRWHCEWFDYDSSICYQINDICYALGIILAHLLCKDEDYDADEDYNIKLFKDELKEGLSFLAKALATLVTWDD